MRASHVGEIWAWHVSTSRNKLLLILREISCPTDEVFRYRIDYYDLTLGRLTRRLASLGLDNETGFSRVA